MKTSIITVVYNNAQYIESCMDSVARQRIKGIEHIIVDAASNDGTTEIIQKCQSDITNWISEPDDGIYHAMNKGIGLATGDIVGFLNSDDLYASSDALETVVSVFENEDIDCCYGDLVYVSRDDTNRVIRNWKSREFAPELFSKGWHPPHPTFFVKKGIYEKYGVFDTKYKIGADYALMLKFLIKYGIRSVYIPQVLVKMRTGGNSNRSIFNIIKANLECYSAWKEYDLPVSPFIVLKKPLSKIAQYMS